VVCAVARGCIPINATSKTARKPHRARCDGQFVELLVGTNMGRQIPVQVSVGAVVEMKPQLVRRRKHKRRTGTLMVNWRVRPG
jgi:hypothetical protein